METEQTDVTFDSVECMNEEMLRSLLLKKDKQITQMSHQMGRQANVVSSLRQTLERRTSMLQELAAWRLAFGDVDIAGFHRLFVKKDDEIRLALTRIQQAEDELRTMDDELKAKDALIEGLMSERAAQTRRLRSLTEHINVLHREMKMKSSLGNEGQLLLPPNHITNEVYADECTLSVIEEGEEDLLRSTICSLKNTPMVNEPSTVAVKNPASASAPTSNSALDLSLASTLSMNPPEEESETDSDQDVEEIWHSPGVKHDQSSSMTARHVDNFTHKTEYNNCNIVNPLKNETPETPAKLNTTSQISLPSMSAKLTQRDDHEPKADDRSIPVDIMSADQWMFLQKFRSNSSTPRNNTTPTNATCNIGTKLQNAEHVDANVVKSTIVVTPAGGGDPLSISSILDSTKDLLERHYSNMQRKVQARHCMSDETVASEQDLITRH